MARNSLPRKRMILKNWIIIGFSLLLIFGIVARIRFPALLNLYLSKIHWLYDTFVIHLFLIATMLASIQSITFIFGTSTGKLFTDTINSKRGKQRREYQRQFEGVIRGFLRSFSSFYNFTGGLVVYLTILIGYTEVVSDIQNVLALAIFLLATGGIYGQLLTQRRGNSTLKSVLSRVNRIQIEINQLRSDEEKRHQRIMDMLPKH